MNIEKKERRLLSSRKKDAKPSNAAVGRKKTVFEEEGKGGRGHTSSYSLIGGEKKKRFKMHSSQLWRL